MSRVGIVNVRMVITEEKILSNIDKVQKLINPNAKKQIVQLDEDAYFKDLIESIKMYLVEYPKKKNFPVNVYKAAYGLVETATSQFEDNTKKIEELIRQREENILAAGKLRDIFETVEQKVKGWKEEVKNIDGEFSEDIIEALTVIGKAKNKEDEIYKDSAKLVKARINNLEGNLHIEIDMERIEDRSKALSYIGIEVADALKSIPAPEETIAIIEEPEEIAIVEEIKETKKAKKSKKVKEEIIETIEPIIEEVSPVVEEVAVASVAEEEKVAPMTIEEELKEYEEEITIKAKTSLWQKIKNSKLVRAVNYLMKIRIRIEVPVNALPEGRGE